MSIDLKNIKRQFEEIESEIDTMIQDHMKKQPYSIECKECGSELTVARKDVDSDGDLKLEISPCEKCCKKE